MGVSCFDYIFFGKLSQALILMKAKLVPKEGSRVTCAVEDSGLILPVSPLNQTLEAHTSGQFSAAMSFFLLLNFF